MNKKSQITIFMIVAFALLFIILFVLSIVSEVREKEMEEQRKEIFNLGFSQTSLKSYVTTCLNTVARDGVRKLSTQGGTIFNHQQGIPGEEVPNGEYADSLSGKSYNISYTILTEGDDLPFYYPCPINYQIDESCGVSLMSDFSNYDRLACLYTNKKSFKGLGDCKFGRLELPRTDFLEGSLKDQLDMYIENHLLECANLSYFNNTEGKTLEAGKPEVNLIFGNEGVSIDLEFRIEVKVEDESEQVSMDFYTSIPTRLKTLYTRLIYVMDSPFFEEFQNVSYDLPTYMRRFIISKDLGFDVEVKKDAVGNDDVLVIKDEQNTYAGRPDTFFFLIENRPPALSYINNSDSIDYDITVSFVDGATINPVADDPDGDDLVYVYRGWKADYNCSYDPVQNTCNRTFLEETRWRDPVDPTQPYDSSTGVAFIKPTIQDEDCLEALRTGNGGNCPHTISGGEVYFNTSLLVYDGSLYDYQDILIEPDVGSALPMPNIEPFYSYDLLDWSKNYAIAENWDTIVSIEDPYMLIHEGDSVVEGSNLHWALPRSNFDTPYLCTYLPNTSKQCKPGDVFSGIDIEDVKDSPIHEDMLDYFDNSSLPTDETLTLETLNGITEDKDITVVECMPHRSPLAPYPYTQGGMDPYHGNHTCCADNFAYMDETTVCVDDTFYVCGDMDLPYDNQNDILKKTVQRFCSGDRGNVCLGAETSSSEVHISCGDKTRDTDIARCSACTNSLYEFEETVSGLSQCQTFGPGESFESTILGNTNIYCNEYNELHSLSPICSPSEGPENFGKGGALACMAQCNAETGECDDAVDCYCSSDCLSSISAYCDGRPPNSETGTCSYGEPYFPDICTSSCAIADDTGIFKCDGENGCDDCDPLCDGLTPNEHLSRCALGEAFFADKCDGTGQLVDGTDAICRGPGYSSGCTAADECNGEHVGAYKESCYVDPNTGEVSNFAAYCNSACQLDESDVCMPCAGNGVDNDVDPGCIYRRPGDAVGCRADKPYLSVQCDDNCQVITSESYCYSYGSCTASEACHRLQPGEAFDIDGDGATESGCSSTCIYKDCSPYNFDPSSGACFTWWDVTGDTEHSPEEKAEIYCNDPSTYNVNLAGTIENCNG